MNKRYIVTLEPDERAMLLKLTDAGKASARRIKRAYVLLKADTAHADGGWTDERISEAYGVHVNTCAEVRKRFVHEGVDLALSDKPRGPRMPKLDGRAEAQLVKLACSPAPDGRARWTLRLLAKHMVDLAYVPSVSYETIRQTLKKTNSSRGAKNNGAFRPKRMRSSPARWRRC